MGYFKGILGESVVMCGGEVMGGFVGGFVGGYGGSMWG